MSFLDNLQWRFATKSFNPSKGVNETDLNKILEAIRMVPTSYGLQQFHVIVVTDTDLKAQMKSISFNQSQVVDASHILVFCARTDMKSRVKEYGKISSPSSMTDKAKLKAYQAMILADMARRSKEDIKQWSAKQTYIALGFAMAACAELRVDSCPMEGFKSKKMDELLELPDHLFSTVLLPIGYRTKDPDKAKVRFDNDDLFTLR